METKKCNKCGEVKGIECYCKKGKRKDGSQMYRPECLSCNRAYGREHRQKNRESIKESKKKYRQKNRESIKEYQKEYYQNNKEYQKEYYQNIKEAKKAYQKEYYQNNKEVVKEVKKAYGQTPKGRAISKSSGGKRRAIELGAPYSVDLSNQYLLTKQLLNNKCAYCGVILIDTEELEHIVPLAKGGTHTPDNIVCSCKACNSSKWAHPMEQWYREQSFFDPIRLLAIEAIQAYWRGEEYEVIIPSTEEIEQARREAEGTLDTLSYIKTAPAELIISEI